jgi:nucleotide-binding universal stress UspA family protein
VKRTATEFAFISHGDADREFASEVAKSLRESGIDSWVDARDLDPGVNWLRSAARALDRADAMILILSNETSGSPELRKAFEFAITTRRFENRLVTIERRAPGEPPFRYPWILRDLPFVKEAQDPRRVADKVIEFLKTAA